LSLQPLRDLRKEARRLRSILNPSQSYGLDWIDVLDHYAVLEQDDQTMPRIPLVLGSNIEAVLIPHTQQRFRQHSETPFGSGMRSQRLGRDCTSFDAQALSQGTYDFDLEQLTPEALEWFWHLRLHELVRDKREVGEVLVQGSREHGFLSVGHPLMSLQDRFSSSASTRGRCRLLARHCHLPRVDGSAPIETWILL
jgi:hypothetical protein